MAGETTQSTSTTDDSAMPGTVTLETVTLDEGTPIVTVASAEDMVTWGSHVLAVEAVAESERNTSSLGPGETMIGRDVTVLVREVLWSHPQAVTQVAQDEQLPVYTFPGFLRTDGETVPAVEDGQLRMAVGEEYVVVMADDTTTEGDQVLTLPSTLEPDDGILTMPDGTKMETAAARATLVDASRLAPADSAPRPGESLVRRLERQTDSG